MTDESRPMVDGDGVVDPPDALQFVSEELDLDGHVVRNFLCLSCTEVVEAPAGQVITHECPSGHI